MTVLFITTGTTFTAPADWPGFADMVECIGGGSAGRSGSGSGHQGSGGGGGAYAMVVNLKIANGASLQIGAGGQTTAATGTDTWIVSSATVLAKGSAGGGSISPGPGGQASACIGLIKFSGGPGGQSNLNPSCGGGGAAGPNGPGASGAPGDILALGGLAVNFATGGGGANGGRPGFRVTASSSGNGGDSRWLIGGGQGAAGSADGEAGRVGGGGGGSISGAGGIGGTDPVWDPTHGPGGGGGSSFSGTCGVGGLYGGGGAGGGNSGLLFGKGAAGLIVITYNTGLLFPPRAPRNRCAGLTMGLKLTEWF